MRPFTGYSGALGAAFIMLLSTGCAGSGGPPNVAGTRSTDQSRHPQRQLPSISTTFVFVGDYKDTHVVGFSGPPFGLPFFNQKVQVEALAHNSTGDLFVGVPNEALEFTPPYTGASTVIPTGNTADNIAFDSSNNLYAATPSGIVRCAVPYSSCTTIVKPPTMNVATDVNGFAVAPDGTVFGLTFLGAGQPTVVDAVAPPYTGNPLTLADSQDNPSGVATDADGNAFTYVSLTSPTTRAIVREYVAPYNGPPITNIQRAVPLQGGAMRFDSRSDLFVAGLSAIKEYAPPYRADPIAAVNINSHGNIALDTTNTLFADNLDTNQVFYFAPPYNGFGQHIHRDLNNIAGITVIGP